MQCAKLNLLDRSKIIKVSDESQSEERPKRFCQQRMVNPEQENARWRDGSQRFCNSEEHNDIHDRIQIEREPPDLCLSVQNLQFHGNVQQRKRPRTSYKYKKPSLGLNHRMFVKEVVDDIEKFDTDRESELSCYGDYAKYYQNSLSRRSSRESIVILRKKENKTVQVDMQEKKLKKDCKVKRLEVNKLKDDIISDEDEKDTKVAFNKYGTRKSLTITRTECPETVQVIRVDVVCNYSNSSTMSDHEETKKQYNIEAVNKSKEAKKNLLANKYFLTKSVKTLDENISGGKVTLLCKTYRLTDRCRRYEKKTKISKEINTKKCKVQK